MGGDAVDIGHLNHPCRFVEYLLVNPFHGILLLLQRSGCIHVTWFILCTHGAVVPANVVDHMPHVAEVLTDDVIVEYVHVVVIDVLLVVGRPFSEAHDFAFQVHKAITAGLHGIVAQVFRLAAGINLAALTVAPPQARILLGLSHQRLHQSVVIIGVVGLHGHVPPLDGPYVIVTDAGEDALAADAVFGLRHIIEACIIHNAGRVAVCFHPGLGTKTVHRHGAAAAEVVPERECVSHLMTADKADELSHQFFVEIHLAGRLVDAAGLHQIPVVHQTHHIVVPADVAFQYFARAGVTHVRAIGVLDGGGQIADAAVAGVLHAHGGVVFRPLACLDGILPSCLLKGLLPVLHALNQIFAPLLGCGRVDIVDDGLHGFHGLSCTLARHILGACLQSPAGGYAHGFHTLLVIGKLVVSVGEIPHARVEIADGHGISREHHEAHVEAEGDLARLSCGGDASAVGGEGLHHAHLGVHGERLDVLDIAHFAYHALQLHRLLELIGEAHGGIVLVEEGRHFNLAHSVLVLLHLEAADNGMGVADGDGLAYLLRAVGYIDEEHAAQKQLSAGCLLEAYGLLVHLLSAEKPDARGRTGEAHGGEEFAPQQCVGHMEVPFVLLLRHAEHARTVNLRFLCLHAVGRCFGRSLLALPAAFLSALLLVLFLLLLLLCLFGLLLVLCLFGTGHLRAGKEAEAQQEHNLSVIHKFICG